MREIRGWALLEEPNAELAKSALQHAINQHQPDTHQLMFRYLFGFINIEAVNEPHIFQAESFLLENPAQQQMHKRQH